MRLLATAGVVVVVGCGGLRALSADAATRSGPFADYARPYTLSLIGRAVIFAALVWSTTRQWVQRSAWNAATTEERQAWTAARTRGPLTTSVWAFFVTISFWNTWSDPETAQSAVGILLRVAPFVLGSLVLCLGIDSAVRRLRRRRGADVLRTAPLWGGLVFVGIMAGVMMPVTNAFYYADEPGGVLDAYARMLDALAHLSVAMLPMLGVMTLLMVSVFWVAPRVDGWVEAWRARA